MKPIFNLLTSGLVAVGICAVMSSNVAHARNFLPVNCDKGAMINDALDQRDVNEKLLVQISGTCDEDVLITNDDVTLTKDPDGAPPTIQSITVDGASRATLKDLIVDADATAGITGKNGASLVVDNVITKSVTKEGILLEGNAVADIKDSTINENGGDGIKVTGGAVADIKDSKLNDNDGDGIAVESGATATVETTEIFGNAENGVSADGGASVQIANSEIDKKETSGAGAEAKDKSVLKISETDVKGDISISGASLMQLIKGTKGDVEGDISVSEGSTIKVSGSTVTGEVKLSDLSSANLSGSTVNGNISLFNLSTVKDGTVLDGVITADLGSTVIGSNADIIATRRSMVTDAEPTKMVELKTQSAGDEANDCDFSSSVFEGDNIDTAAGCVVEDLNHFFDKIAALPDQLFDEFSSMVSTLFDEMKSAIKSLIKDLLP